MHKIQKHIYIARSSVPALSSLSMVSCSSILEVLKEHYAEVTVATINTAVDLKQLVSLRPDLVFMGMKFVPTTTGPLWLAAYLDAHDIAYTGSDAQAHVLELNKDLAKQRVLQVGLATSPFFVAKQHQPFNANAFGFDFPVFIKPRDRGGGQGIDSYSVAHTPKAAIAKIRAIATQHKADALVEKYLPGREFSVAMLRNQITNDYMSMPLELIAPPDDNGQRLLSSAVKSADAESFQAIDDPVLKQRITDLAKQTFIALGGRDYGRIDIRLDAAGNPHFLEANLLPSLISGYGSFPKACLLMQGIDYKTMILAITRLGLERQIAIPKLPVSVIQKKPVLKSQV